MGGSDFCSSLPPRFVSVAWRYLVGALLVRSVRGAARGPRRPGLWFSVPRPIAPEETSRPPRFLDSPCARAPLSDPAGAAIVLASRRPRCCFPLKQRRQPPARIPFEAPSRGPRARCLRFTPSVTRRRARLASGWLPALAGRDFHPRGCFGGFFDSFDPQRIASPPQASPGALFFLPARCVAPRAPQRARLRQRSGARAERPTAQRSGAQRSGAQRSGAQRSGPGLPRGHGRLRLRQRRGLPVDVRPRQVRGRRSRELAALRRVAPRAPQRARLQLMPLGIESPAAAGLQTTGCTIPQPAGILRRVS